MAIPVIVYFVVFVYLPMYGLIIAFKDYRPFNRMGQGGIWGSPWADYYGFGNFVKFFQSPLFWSVIKNTIYISLLGTCFSFPAPIIFALMLNEIKNLKYKKIIQTITYLPHFISMVVICSMIIRFFQTEGILTKLITLLGGEKQNYMINEDAYRPIFVGSGIWQGVGWGSIIYISALSSIDQELYEAAVIDGAGKWKQLVHITIPGILSTIVILLIMNIGSILSVGYEKTILLQNDKTASVARVISSYTYDLSFGEGNSDFAYSSAIGIFQSVVNIIFLTIANTISKKVTDSGLF
ncbi:MAG: sugar ABC transporter permease [Clostridia bacterium]|nr:sugar ABC transporter permease [Clostridia bacterium]